jgi:hypothetical protein
MIPLNGSTFLVCRRLKTSKYGIKEDKPLHKFDVQELGSAEYTYLLEDRTPGVINQHFFLINPGLSLSLNISRTSGLRLFGVRELLNAEFENLPE